MPYIIAVLALVILGTGYTLFERTTTPSEAVAGISLSETIDTNVAEQITPTDTFNDTDAGAEKEKDDQRDADYDDNPSPTNPKEQAAVPKPPPTLAPAADSNRYTDGTYYATKSYRTPDGTYQMNVSVTVKNDRVTGSTLSFDADGARDGYSKRFSNGYQTQVIGMDLGTIQLSRVGGASLTTNAFNSAVSSIVSQAS